MFLVPLAVRLLKRVMAAAASLCLMQPAWGQTSPQGITLQGRIAKPDAQPLEEASVTFTIEVRTAGIENCLLYKEQQTMSMADSDGLFSITIGSGTRAAGASFENTSTLAQAFSNNSTALTPVICQSGATSFTPSTGLARKVKFTFNDGSGDQSVTELVPFNSVPYALNADAIQGKAPTDFIQVKNTGAAVTQTNLESVFASGANVTELLALIAGTSAKYTKVNGTNFLPTAAVDMNSQRLTNVATPTAGTDAANRTYVDTYIGGKTTDAAGIAALAAGDAGKALVWDGTQWTASAGTATDGTKLPLAGGTMSGAIAMGGNNITGVGYLNISAQKYLGLGSFDDTQEGTLVTSTLTPGGNAYKGATWYNSTDNVVKYWNGSAVIVMATGATALTSLNGSTQPVQTFATPGTSGTAPAWSTNAGTGAHTLNVPMASAAGVTAGLVSKTDYDAFAAKQSATLADGNILVGNGSNVATAVTASGDATMTNAGVVTVGKVQGKAFASTAPTDGQVYVWNNTASQWQPKNFNASNLISAAGTSQFANASCAAGQTLTWSALTDTFTCTNISVTKSQVSDLGTVGDFMKDGSVAMTGNLKLGGKYLSNDGGSEGVAIDDNGKVGIGTTAPASNLDVSTTTGSTLTLSRNDTTMGADTLIGKIDFWNNDSNLTAPNNVFASIEARSYQTVTTNSTAGVLVLKTSPTSNGQSPIERMRIDQAGNVGIGTSAPNEKLTVEGSISLDQLGANPTGTAGYGNLFVKTDGKLYYRDGTGTVTDLLAGSAAVTSLNGSTVQTQTFATPGTSGTAPAWSTNTGTGVHTLDIPMASAASVTAGLLSKTDYDAFAAKQSATLADGKILVGNGSNVATAVAASGDATMTNAGVVTVAKIHNRTIASTAPTDGQVYVWVNGSTQWQPKNFNASNLITAAGTSQFANSSCATSQTLTWSALTDTFTCSNISITKSQISDLGTVGVGDFLKDGSVTMTGNIKLGGKWLSNDGGDEGIQVDNTGQVGVGGTPSYPLDVTGSTKISGSVGIGTNPPATSKLSVVTSGVNTGITGTNAYTGTDSWGGKFSATGAATNNIGIYATATGATNNYAAIFDSGNVGIGTTAPTDTLDVRGTGLFKSGTANPLTTERTDAANGNTTVLKLQRTRSDSTAPSSTFAAGLGATLEGFTNGQVARTGSINFGWENNQTNDTTDRNGYMSFRTLSANTNESTYGDERMRISSGGYVGIGTTNPGNAIHVVKNGGTTGTQVGRFSSDDTWGTGLEIANTSAGATTWQLYSYGSGATVGNFSIVNASTPRLTINTTGNVGVGTTAPNDKLTVEGGMTFKQLASNPAGTAGYGSLFVRDDGKIYYRDGTGTVTDLTAGGGGGAATSVTASVGSAGSPSMSFSGDSDTGFYNASSNDTISVSAGNSNIFNFSSAGLVSGTTGGGLVTTANGTAGAPALSFAGDPDTGWWRPAANTMAGSTGGTERIRIDSSGNVAIGVTSATSKVAISRGGANAPTTINAANEYLHIGGGEQGVTNNNRIIGFGYMTSETYSPTYIGMQETSVTGSGKGDLVFGTRSATTDTAPSERMRVTDAGRVGIGTTGPTTALDIKVSDSANDVLRLQNTHTAGFSSVTMSDTAGTNKIGFGFINSGSSYAAMAGKGVTWLDTGVDYTITTTSTNLVTFKNGGNVGIGTTSPTAKLSVVGSMVSTPTAVASGVAVDLSTSNTFTLASVGGSSGSAVNIALSNLVNGGVYTIVITDTVDHIYDFTGCTAKYWKPAKAITTSGTRTIYTVTTINTSGSNYDCYVTWATGYQ